MSNVQFVRNSMLGACQQRIYPTHSKFYQALVAEAGKTVVPKVAIRDGGQYLDGACGSGTSTYILRDHLQRMQSAKVKILGVDLDPHALTEVHVRYEAEKSDESKKNKSNLIEMAFMCKDMGHGSFLRTQQIEGEVSDITHDEGNQIRYEQYNSIVSLFGIHYLNEYDLKTFIRNCTVLTKKEEGSKLLIGAWSPALVDECVFSQFLLEIGMEVNTNIPHKKPWNRNFHPHHRDTKGAGSDQGDSGQRALMKELLIRPEYTVGGGGQEIGGYKTLNIEEHEVVVPVCANQSGDISEAGVINIRHVLEKEKTMGDIAALISCQTADVEKIIWEKLDQVLANGYDSVKKKFLLYEAIM